LAIAQAIFNRLAAAESYENMPIYEYHCQRCGVFEVTQRITENPLTLCPTCEGDVRRLISATSFVLKGSGWYATDYARSNGKAESSGETGAKEATSGSGDKSAASSSDSTKATATESSKSNSDSSTSAKSAA
jgi:putative FmdB family regulatory protein